MWDVNHLVVEVFYNHSMILCSYREGLEFNLPSSVKKKAKIASLAEHELASLTFARFLERIVA